MAKRVCPSILITILVAGIAGSQSLVNVEVESWVYPLLDRFTAKGYFYIDTEVRPLTRGEIAEALKPLLGDIDAGATAMSPVDRYNLARLETEFAPELDADLEHRPRYQDIPLFRLIKEGNRVNFDVNLEDSVSMIRVRLKDGTAVSLDTLLAVSTTSLGLESYGQYRDRLAYDEWLTFSLIEGDEDIASAYSGRGLRRWKSGTASIDRAYMKLGLGPVQLEAGRDQFLWGPGRFGSLLVSSGGEPLDHVGLNVVLWGVSARGFTALLSPDQGIYLSAHRLSFRLPFKTILAVSEAVVYHRNSFPELQYVNPLVPYYMAEHNLKQDDNTLWNFSLVSSPGAGIRLYGEFLIDDVQYERSARAPDKLGGIAGIHISDPLRFSDSDLRCEYTRLNKWVYTHRDSSNKYVGSGTPIGEVLGPDSDRLVVEMSHRPSRLVEIFLGYMYLRHGEGTVDLPWEEELGDPRPPFPSGKVETCNGLFAHVSYRPTWWFFLKGGAEYTRTRNSTAFGMRPEKPIDRWQWDLLLRVDI
ncbi:MAG: capsule assembly Wzi family protein [bacterium]